MRDFPEYKTAFAESEIIAARTLEDEAVRRAHQGVRKAVRYKGKVVGYEHEYSDTLMSLLLKGSQPKKYRDNSSVEVTGKDGEQLFPTAAIEAYFKAQKDADEDYETRS